MGLFLQLTKKNLVQNGRVFNNRPQSGEKSPQRAKWTDIIFVIYNNMWPPFTLRSKPPNYFFLYQKKSVRKHGNNLDKLRFKRFSLQNENNLYKASRFETLLLKVYAIMRSAGRLESLVSILGRFCVYSLTYKTIISTYQSADTIELKKTA